ncbi:MAG: hypothetical protein AAF433_03700 [Bacteroidota bacterium]
MRTLITVLLLLFVVAFISAQLLPDIRHSVKLEAAVMADSAQIQLSWVEDEAVAGYELYRRDYPEGAWGQSLASYPAGVNEHLDEEVELGQLYEYRIIKTNTDFDSLGYGYLLSGIELPPVHYSGRILIVQTTTTAAAIPDAVADYQEVLLSDGWQTGQLIVPDGATAEEVKNLIVANYADVPFNVILILGDVPIPHSGNLAADGHNNHRGAWSADVYYGDLDGEWTDTIVNNTTSTNARNHNIPGDGRWDQSAIPSEVEVAVGRVDFSELPAFPEDEYELLRQYLAKDIAYRRGELPFRQRAMVRNINPWDGGLAQNGLRNFAPLVSLDSMGFGEWSIVFSEAYQWYYGGSAGNYTVGYQMGNSAYFAANDFQSIFTAWFGSYFGDYDYPDAYMRSHLGSGTVLSSVWAGAPHWYFHPMAMGFPLATATLATQNNDTLYHAGFYARGVHVNLLGDPSLKAFVFQGPTAITSIAGTGYVDLSWEAGPTENLACYYLYRRSSESGVFDLLDSISVDQFSYRDNCLQAGASYQYLVRASRLETTPSGSFYNLSAGPMSPPVTVMEGSNLMASFQIVIQEGDLLILQSTTENVDSLLWLFPDGSTATSGEVTYELSEGENLIKLVAYNSCGRDTIEQAFVLSDLAVINEMDLSVFPNPVHDQLSIRWSKPAFADVSLQGLDGRQLANWRVEGKSSIDLFVGALPQVLALLVIRHDDGRVVSRRVVLH